jgi:hypothetical protein
MFEIAREDRQLVALRCHGDDDVGETTRMALPSRAVGDGTARSGGPLKSSSILTAETRSLVRACLLHRRTAKELENILPSQNT